MMRRQLLLHLNRQIFDRSLSIVSLAHIHKPQVIRLLCHYEHTRHRKKPQGGARILTDSSHVFEFNAWDNVVWDEEQENEARRKTAEQSSELLSQDQNEKYEKEADANWDAFYDQHQNRFFKDRHWLFTEFPELLGKSIDECYVDKKDDDTSPSVATNDVGDGLVADLIGCSSGDASSEQVVADKPTRLSSAGVSHDAGSMTMPSTSRSECDSLTLTRDETDIAIQACSNSLRTLGIDGDSEKCTLQPESELPEATDRDNNDEISSTSQTDCSYPGVNSTFRILEVGCGVGNTVFPVLQTNNDPALMVYCCDFSSTAIKIVKEHPDFNPSWCHAFVCDVSSPDSRVPFPEQSLDVVILIFVLSAINPEKMQSVIDRLASFLKPGGILLFRDYGRYDMAQLRFKKDQRIFLKIYHWNDWLSYRASHLSGRCLSENFYVRGDGTRVYFFTQEELHEMFTSSGLTEKQNSIDRRLQVNRGRQLKMYRVWIQCKYEKSLLPTKLT